MTARLTAWADRIEAYNERRRMEDESRLRAPRRLLPWHRRVVAHVVAHAILCSVAGFEVSTLWRWFLRPMGLPPLGFWQAIGVAMLAASLTFSPGADRTIGEVITGRIGRAVVRLTIGAVVWIAMGGWR